MVGSITDAPTVRAALAGVDGCFHLAAIASVTRCNQAIAVCNRTNLAGFLLILEAIRDAGGRIPCVFASSAAVYGSHPEAVSETELPAPSSHYGSDKLACELHARAAANDPGLATIALRFFNVYGPGQDPSSPYSGVISIFARQAERGAALEIYGDGSQMRDFVFVADVVEAQIMAMAYLAAAGPGRFGVFNVCTGRAVSIRTLADTIQQVFGRVPAIVQRDPRPGDIRISVGCPEAAGAAFGFRASTTLAQGLETLRQAQQGAPSTTRL